MSWRASWYGPGFHGNRTANGEVYDQWGMTAAHKTLPFGTRLRVTNVANGRTLEVRINVTAADMSDGVPRDPVVSLPARPSGVVRTGGGGARVSGRFPSPWSRTAVAIADARHRTDGVGCRQLGHPQRLWTTAGGVLMTCGQRR